MSAVRAIGPSQNLKIVPMDPCRRTSPASSLSFRHTSLFFNAALQKLTLSGVFEFSAGWCDKYHSFRKVTFNTDSSNIFMKPYTYIYWLLKQIFQIWVPLESLLQRVKLTPCWAVVVRYVWLWFTPYHSYIFSLASKLCRALEHLLCLQFRFQLTDDVDFGSKGFYVPPCSDILSIPVL